MEIGKFYLERETGHIWQCVKAGKQAHSIVNKEGKHCLAIAGLDKTYWKEITIPEMIEQGYIKKGDFVKWFFAGDEFAKEGIYKGLADSGLFKIRDQDELFEVYEMIPHWARSQAEIKHRNK